MIKNNNIMYIFCEVINQLEPESILDVGMFYKSIGGVSRQILNADISRSIYITGVRTDKKDNLNVYNKVYDDIISMDDICECPYAYKPHSYNSCYSKENNNDDNKKYLKYDLAIMLSDLVESKDKDRLIRNIEDKAAYLLIYQDDVKYLTCNYKGVDIEVDDEKCILIYLSEE